MSINIITVLFTDDEACVPEYCLNTYGPHWVDKMYRGFKRNCNEKFNFFCLVDKEYRFKENVISVPLIQGETGWLSLAEFWRPEICDGQRFCLGLDQIIMGDVTDILSTEGDLIVCKDPHNTRRLANAVITVSKNKCKELWPLWQKDLKERPETLMFHGKVSEMQFLRNYYGLDRVRAFEDLFPNRVLSYKAHLHPYPDKIKGCSIAYFHGRPRPSDDILTEVKKHWI